MVDLLLDIKILIASFDECVWYILYTYDKEFNYAHKHSYIRHYYIQNFLKVVKYVMPPLKYGTILFGNLNTVYDNPCISTADYQIWYRNGRYHRDGDLPAMVSPGGKKSVWYKNGQIHRDGDLPAVVVRGGAMYWYKHGQLHRDGDLPAIINENGTKEWYKNNKLHRDNGLPSVVLSNGNEYWYVNGLFTHKSTVAK